jgi:hypothetical protein
VGDAGCIGCMENNAKTVRGEHGYREAGLTGPDRIRLACATRGPDPDDIVAV